MVLGLLGWRRRWNRGEILLNAHVRLKRDRLVLGGRRTEVGHTKPKVLYTNFAFLLRVLPNV
jgi:hypothetical protein